MKTLALFLIAFSATGLASASEVDFSMLAGDWESVDKPDTGHYSMSVKEDGEVTIKLNMVTSGMETYMPCHGNLDQAQKIDDIVIITCSNTKKAHFKLVASYAEADGEPSLKGSVFGYHLNRRGRVWPVHLVPSREADNKSLNTDASNAGAG